MYNIGHIGQNYQYFIKKKGYNTIVSYPVKFNIYFKLIYFVILYQAKADKKYIYFYSELNISLDKYKKNYNKTFNLSNQIYIEMFYQQIVKNCSVLVSV